MADDDPVSAALRLKEPGPARHWSFHVSDIVLTAALLAGDADRIHKVMDNLPQVQGSFRFERQWND